MSKGWHREVVRHSLAARGQKTTPDTIKKESKTKSKRQTIIVDLDGTIFNPNFRKSRAERMSKAKSVESREESNDIFFRELFNSKLVKSDRPIEGTAEFLQKLSKKYDIVYVTARPPRMARATSTQMKKNEFPEGKVHYRPDSAETVEFKTKRYAEQENVVLIIGDRPTDQRAARFASRETGSRLQFFKVRENKPWDENFINRKLERGIR